ncbi:30S ribosomal protein S18 [Patescibacteria group bacterium]|nr:30S ribosomal protein S18 [Patescibacteria group bacterium]
MECYFCKRNIKDIEFQNTAALRQYISGLGKIRSKRKTGLCSGHQRKISKAIKRARHLGLISATQK